MFMTNLKHNVLQILGDAFDSLLENRKLIMARNWCRKHKSQIIRYSLAALAFLLMFSKMTANPPQKATAETNEEPEIVEEIVSEEPESAEEEIVPVSDPYRSEAEAVAKVLYGTARGNTETDQRAVVWCIINRCESTLFPNTIEEVCSQKQQWMGYSDSNPIVQELYDIAHEELSTWHEGGYRMIAPDFLFLSWSSKEIVLRTQFEENGATRYWRAK